MQNNVASLPIRAHLDIESVPACWTCKCDMELVVRIVGDDGSAAL